MRTAVMFPGQGSQTPGMHEHVRRARPDLLALATELAGGDPFDRIHEGTRYTQPAIFCAGLASWEELRALEPRYVAGHSLGELTALAAGGWLSEEDALRLVVERGRLMDVAARAAPGGMLALIGARAAHVVRATAEARAVTVANDNAPFQVVLAGNMASLERVAVYARTEGVRAVPLAVDGAFHSPAMAAAVPEFREALDGVEFLPPRIAVISSVTGHLMDDPRRRLAEAITRTVRWRSVLEVLHGFGVRRFVEAAPGRVLTGLVRRTLPDIEAVTAAQLAEAHA